MYSQLQELSQDIDVELKERLVMEQVEIFAQCHDFDSIYSFITGLSDIWRDVSTARLTKIIKKTLFLLPSDNIEGVLGLVTLFVTWAEKTNRKLLSYDLECKRINALLRMKMIDECLSAIKKMLVNLKKIDDKENQIMLYVCECKAYYELRDLSRSRTSLTSARAMAVSTYCPSLLQAHIDLLSGMLICDDHFYSTAFSYFLEAIDGFTTSKEPENTLTAIRYLILSKIITKKHDEIGALLRSKPIVNFINDRVVLAFLEINESYKNRNLESYQRIINQYSSILGADSFIKKHLEHLYGVLFENNILKIIEPYSNISIAQIANQINFPGDVIEEKIRKMILDKQISGTIDHVNQCILLFDEKENEVDAREDHIKTLKEFVSSL